jgi:VWFA-related protein
MKYLNPLPRHFSFLIIIALTTPAASKLGVVPRSSYQSPIYSMKFQGAEKVAANLVNVDFVVYKKGDAQIITNLKKTSLAVFVDGVQKEITNFWTPDRPIAAVLLVEYSRLGALLDDNSSLGLGAVSLSAVQPAGALLRQTIKSPDDHTSVVAFDIRPTPMTDLTNDPKRIDEAVDLLLRNTPAFRESALFDSLSFILMGERGDAAVLDKPRVPQSDHSGLASVQGKRRAVILIASGLDTSSKNLRQARKTIQNAGVPIFVIGTGGMFKAQAGNRLSSKDNDQLKQADAQLNTIALETGGAFYSYNAESDGPGILEKISAMVRGQYSLTFVPDEIHDGKAHKIVVKVDVDGDGAYDEQTFVVQARQVYNAPKK